jgi:hypothetical protein
MILAGNELSHGIYNARFINGLALERARAIIRDSARTILERTGQKPSGWLGPALCVRHTITDNLAAEGFDCTRYFFMTTSLPRSTFARVV